MICLVLAIENLPAVALGCYGGSGIKTPHFDHLASMGITFNWHFADSTETICESHPWMTGRHSFSACQTDSFSMTGHLESMGIRGITLDEDSANHQDSFSQLIDQALSTLQNLISSEEKPPTLLWLNAHGVSDATELTKEVKQLDAEAGRLFDSVLSLDEANEILFIVTAARGMDDLLQTTFFEQAPLPESRVHTPLIFVAPALGSAERRPELVQTTDLLPTITEWLTQQSAGEQYDGKSLWQILNHETKAESHWRESVYIKASDNIFAIRTSEFYLVEEKETHTSEGATNSFLFLKPDDLWDVYNVASQYPQVVEELQHQLRSFFSQC